MQKLEQLLEQAFQELRPIDVATILKEALGEGSSQLRDARKKEASSPHPAALFDLAVVVQPRRFDKAALRSIVEEGLIPGEKEDDETTRARAELIARLQRESREHPDDLRRHQPKNSPTLSNSRGRSG